MSSRRAALFGLRNLGSDESIQMVQDNHREETCTASGATWPRRGRRGTVFHREGSPKHDRPVIHIIQVTLFYMDTRSSKGLCTVGF